jgi:uncharacterized membrane protein YidH (DUF202 family)
MGKSLFAGDAEFDMKTYSKINLAMSIERTYTSFMRNCIIIFTLGITIINLSKRRRFEKYMLSFVLILSGILLGIMSTVEYYQRIKMIEDEDFKKYESNMRTKTIYITGFIIIIFITLFGYKFANMNDKVEIVSTVKQRLIRKLEGKRVKSGKSNKSNTSIKKK